MGGRRLDRTVPDLGSPWGNGNGNATEGHFRDRSSPFTGISPPTGASAAPTLHKTQSAGKGAPACPGNTPPLQHPGPGRHPRRCRLRLLIRTVSVLDTRPNFRYSSRCIKLYSSYSFLAISHPRAFDALRATSVHSPTPSLSRGRGGAPELELSRTDEPQPDAPAPSCGFRHRARKVLSGGLEPTARTRIGRRH